MNTRPNTSSNTAAAALIAGLGSILLGCSGDTPSSLQLCRSSADCTMTSGEECNLKKFVCERVCQQAQCAAQLECSSYFGTCVPVRCGQSVSCADPGDFCDPEVHECYPTSGKCKETSDCPQFDGRVGKSAALSCKDGFCSLASLPPQIASAGSARAPVLRVMSPSPGAQVMSPELLRFQWVGTPGTSTIVLVLTDLPQDLSEVLSFAAWGRVLPVDAEPVAGWQDGVAIQNGVWLPSTPSVPGGPLYFLVQALRAGRLVGTSPPIPFRVGSAWPALYDRCTDNNVLPGSCANPTRPQICWEGYCRLLCASHGDCMAEKSLCGTPSSGVRICG